MGHDDVRAFLGGLLDSPSAAAVESALGALRAVSALDAKVRVACVCVCVCVCVCANCVSKRLCIDE